MALLSMEGSASFVRPLAVHTRPTHRQAKQRQY